MVNLQNTLSVAAVLLLLVGSAFAAQYMVGDADGWSYNVDLEAWAESKTFYVGDVIGKLPRESISRTVFYPSV